MDIWVVSNFSYCKSRCCEHSCASVFDFLLLCGVLRPPWAVSLRGQLLLYVLFPTVSPVPSSGGGHWRCLVMGLACEGRRVGQACFQLSWVGQCSRPLEASLSFQIHEMGLNHPSPERRVPLPLTLGGNGSGHTEDFDCCLWTLHSPHGSEPLPFARLWSAHWGHHRAHSLEAEG